MKILTRLAVIGLLALTAVGCSRVEPGHVGVRVSNYGERGVQGEIVQPGRWVWNGPGYQLYEFPTFKQNYVYKEAEAITFGTTEGLNVSADVGISYRVQAALAPKLFQDYRKGVDEITAVDLRNTIQNAFVLAGGTRKIETVYGAGKAALIEEVKAKVTKQMATSGIQIDNIYWAGNLRLPPQVQQSITNKIQATQIAEQRQNELVKAQAEAAIAEAEAQGRADATILAAQAEAESIRIKGQALRENQNLVDLTLAEKWNGQYPSTLIIGSDKGQILQIPTGNR